MMINVTPIRQSPESVALSNASVVRREGDRYHLLTHGGVVVEARKADGCLLEPELNDLVLASHGTQAGGFILCVLIKEGGLSRLTLKGQARVTAEELTLSAHRTASLEAPEIRLKGIWAALNFLGIDLAAMNLRSRLENADIAAARVDMKLDRLTQRLRNCFRRVEHLDQTKAGRIRRIVRERFSVKADSASVLAKKNVVVDGEEILLG